VKVKGNRPALLAACAGQAAREPPLDLDLTLEQTRGRLTRRLAEVYSPPAVEGWPAIGSVVRVVRSGERTDKGERRAFEHESFYVTSRRDSASLLAEAVRQHWHVENRLHWCKDALMNEDGGGVASMAGAAVLSALRGVALSLLRWNGHWSPTEARALLANRVPQLLMLLRT